MNNLGSAKHVVIQQPVKCCEMASQNRMTPNTVRQRHKPGRRPGDEKKPFSFLKHHLLQNIASGDKFAGQDSEAILFGWGDPDPDESSLPG